MRLGCTRIKCSTRPRATGRPGADDRGALGLGVHVMRRPHDQHDPPFEGFRIVLVDLEGDLVLSVRDAGPQVLFGEGVLEGVEDDRLFVQLVLDRQHGGAKPAGVGQPSDPACADQQQAFGFAQALWHARPGPALRARERATAASTEARRAVRHGSTP
jgi:hypothetical protein